MTIDELFSMPIHEMRDWMVENYCEPFGRLKDNFWFCDLEETFDVEFPENSGWRIIPIMSTYWTGPDNSGYYMCKRVIDKFKCGYDEHLRFAVTKISKYGECLTISLSGSLKKGNDYGDYKFVLNDIQYNDNNKLCHVFLDGADVVNKSEIGVYYRLEVDKKDHSDDLWLNQYEFLDKYPSVYCYDKPVVNAITKNKHSINEFAEKLEKYAKRVQEIGVPAYNENKTILNDEVFRDKCHNANSIRKRVIKPEDIFQIYLECHIKNPDVTIDDAIGMVKLCFSDENIIKDYISKCKAKHFDEWTDLKGYDFYCPYHLALLYDKETHIKTDCFFGLLKDLDKTRELYLTMDNYKDTAKQAKKEYREKYAVIAQQFEKNILAQYNKISSNLLAAKQLYLTNVKELYKYIDDTYPEIDKNDIGMFNYDDDILNQLMHSFETTAAKLQKLLNPSYQVDVYKKISAKEKESDKNTEFLEHCKKLFDVAPSLKEIPYYEVSKCYDAPYEVYENDNFIEKIPENVVYDYEEKYGQDSFDEWIDTFMNLAPFSKKWEKEYGNELYPGRSYYKIITRDLEFTEKEDE